jgi:hypothetical protein
VEAPLVALATRLLTLHLREPRRLAAIALLAVAGGLVLAFDYARGNNAAADALAYWIAVHNWIGGVDPYRAVIDLTQASGEILPYAYPPWTLQLFLPWAILPRATAWLVWRSVGVLLFCWTVRWAYARRPLGTAVLIAILGPALAANFDTGNITILITLGIWAAQFMGPRLAGAIWATSTALKWLPAALIVVLPPRTRAWGMVALGAAAILELATWPDTLKHINIALYYPRPIRVDYMLLIWAAVPWLWRQPWPPWWLQSREIARHWRERPSLRPALRRFFGMDGRPDAAPDARRASDSDGV